MTQSITITLIIVTAVVSIIAFNDRKLMAKLLFVPFDMKEGRNSYRWITHAFIHAGWLHLAINMFVLYNFGRGVEVAYGALFGMKGPLFYLLLYVGGILFSSIIPFIKHKHNPAYASLGASGAVSAVVFSYILLAPTAKLMVMPIPIPIYAFIWGILYLVYSAYMSDRGKDNIGHDAHLWGAVFGFTFTIALRPELFQQFIDNIKGII